MLPRSRADERVARFAAVEHHRGRDGEHAEPRRGQRVLVDVQLRELDLPIRRLLECGEDRLDRLARTAPRCPEVEHDRRVGAEDVAFERVVRYLEHDMDRSGDALYGPCVRLVLALAASILVALVLVQPAPADRDAFRAAVSFWAMRHTFYDARSQSYREVEGHAAPAHAWPYSQALAATIAMADVPKRGPLYLREAAQRVSGLSEFLGPRGVYTSRIRSGDVYYDDNEWIALDLLHWYKLRASQPALVQAQRVFNIVVATWDSDPTHACPGGIPWTSAAGNDNRNTVTTATGALLGLRLYEVTRNPSQLAWSSRC
jgi:Glycosyl hydrolase family 76